MVHRVLCGQRLVAGGESAIRRARLFARILHAPRAAVVGQRFAAAAVESDHFMRVWRYLSSSAFVLAQGEGGREPDAAVVRRASSADVADNADSCGQHQYERQLDG